MSRRIPNLNVCAHGGGHALGGVHLRRLALRPFRPFHGRRAYVVRQEGSQLDENAIFDALRPQAVPLLSYTSAVLVPCAMSTAVASALAETDPR